MIVWEKYVKKYVWDEDKTPYFIPAAKLMRDQADKEIFLYCVFLSIPAAMIVAAFVSDLGNGGAGNLAMGLYGAAILASAAYMKFRKSTAAAMFAVSAPIVMLLHFAINGFAAPDLNVKKAEIAATDTAADTLTLEPEKRWRTGHSMELSSRDLLPAPLVEGETYFLIRKSESLYQLASTLEEAKAGVAMNLVSEGEGRQVIRRVVKLHFFEQAAMIVIVLLWLRYTFRAIAITRVYPGLPVRDMNPWSKLPPGASPPRK